MGFSSWFIDEWDSHLFLRQTLLLVDSYFLLLENLTFEEDKDARICTRMRWSVLGSESSKRSVCFGEGWRGMCWFNSCLHQMLRRCCKTRGGRCFLEDWSSQTFCSIILVRSNNLISFVFFIQFYVSYYRIMRHFQWRKKFQKTLPLQDLTNGLSYQSCIFFWRTMMFLLWR